ncbi:MAG: hypothetical protein ACREHC_07650 [Candidatus Levyibacteriota bacterium]
MRNNAIIYADQEKEEEQASSLESKQSRITLSQQEYRKIVKEAYKEGVKEALEDKKNIEPFHREVPGEAESIAKEVAYGAKSEAARSEAKKKEESKHRLDELKKRQEIELLRIKSMFPFSLFPDTLIIDTTKVTLAKKQLFATEYITTIPLKDLADVTVQTALFLASISMKYLPHTEVPGMTAPIDVTSNAYKRADAIRAKNILKGAVVAKAEEVDIAKLSPQEVKEVIEKFGQSEGIE